MATGRLTAARLKAVSDKDVGSILNDGDGLRGRVRRNRAGEITVQFEYKYRVGTKHRTAKVEQWPKKSLAEIRSLCRDMKTALSKGNDPIEARKAEKLENRLELVQQIEKQKQEIERIAVEAAAKRSFSDALTQWEKLELARRKDGGKEAMRSIKKLMPFLLLLFCGKAMAYENPIEIIEYIDDVKVVAHINKSAINQKLRWKPFESPLPLSIVDALQAVQKYIKSHGEITDVKLRGIELKRMAHDEKLWHYLVKLNYKSGEDTRPHFFVVLMDGKVISALREPESIK